MSSTRPMHIESGEPTVASASSVCRRLLACVAVLCCLLPFVVAPSAGADEVTDLEARADRIAQDLLDLQTRIGEIGEQFNQSQIRRAELDDRKADLEQRSRVARLEMAARRADAARYAMSAYVGIDEGDVLAMALDGRQWDLSRRTGYASIRIGDREQIVDDLRAAEKTNADLIDALADANRAEQQLVDDLERQQDEATRLIAEQEALQASVQGELAEAVARRQAALAAAAQQAPAPGTTAERPAVAGSDPAAPSVAGPLTPGAPPGTAGSATTAATGSTPTTAAPTTRPPGGGQPPTPPPPTTVPPPPPVVPPTTGRGQTAANAAISQLGVRYSWGGGNASGPSMGFGPGAGIVGFDCSGLTLYAWAQAGVSLPHSAQMQYDLSAKVGLSALQVGDLVFYGTSSTNISHVAIYVGGGQVVHAPNSRSVVQYGAVDLWGGYYAWIGAGRPG